jgi:hypothetical protein
MTRRPPIALTAGIGLDRLTPDNQPLRVREGFLVVALAWIVAPLFGALPFLLGGVAQLDRPLDAYFEAVSGLTATGATVVTDVDELGRGMLFWRQLTHWLGGMGIIVLALALLPRLRIGGRDLLRSELPGPSDTRAAPHDGTRHRTAAVEGLCRRHGGGHPGPRDHRLDRVRPGAGPVRRVRVRALRRRRSSCSTC